MIQGDTASCPFGFGNLSSRGLIAGGGAASLAAEDVASKLRAVAAAMLHGDAGEIVLRGGMAAVAGDAERAVPIAAVAHAAYALGYILALGLDEPTLEATRTYRPPNIRHLPDEGGHIHPFRTFRARSTSPSSSSTSRRASSRCAATSRSTTAAR